VPAHPLDGRLAAEVREEPLIAEFAKHEGFSALQCRDEFEPRILLEKSGQFSHRMKLDVVHQQQPAIVVLPAPVSQMRGLSPASRITSV
jgi:hypothetical protein